MDRLDDDGRRRTRFLHEGAAQFTLGQLLGGRKRRWAADLIGFGRCAPDIGRGPLGENGLLTVRGDKIETGRVAGHGGAVGSQDEAAASRGEDRKSVV